MNMPFPNRPSLHPGSCVWATLLAFVCFSLSPARLEAQEPGYFRLLTPSNQVVLSFSADGTLAWNAPTGYFLVERATNLAQPTWAPWARGTSVTTSVTLKVHDFLTPPGMAFIPAGYFTMGDQFGDLPGVAVPVHTVYVSPFYIDKFEVTNEQMRQVLQWAYDLGKVAIIGDYVVNIEGSSTNLVRLGQYDALISFSSGQFAVVPGRTNQPCVWITWYGAVAYCNFLSEIEGLVPCYDLTNWTCNFSKNGYRLPTEAEWEKAARGGYEGYRFPWIDTSNTISHAQANYKSVTNIDYDVSPTRGYNPAGGIYQPYTTPVGYFGANGYGLYDMAGNVWEFVWDWAGNYPGTTQFDPTGPTSGTFKIFRGGSWLTTAERLTCAARYTAFYPTNSFDDIGFRKARNAGP